jgi:SAM-dependent methyltransferase
MDRNLPYSLLSAVYDRDWGGFSLGYLELVQKLADRLGLSRARVLDLACGTGTLAVELAHRGHTVLGIDLSPEMLALARSKAERVQGVRFEEGDMRDVAVTESFDIATCTFDAINYAASLTALERTLSSVHTAVRPAGWFAFDSVTRRLFEEQNGGTFVRSIGRRRVRQTLRYDAATLAARTTFTFEDGSTEVHLQRPWGLEELDGALERTGWRLHDVWSGFGGTRPGKRSQRLICTALREA